MKKILIVDDEDQNLRLIEAMLLPMGYEVIPTSNGEDALEKVRERRPDVILLDIMMPGEDGISLTGFVHQNTALPVLLLTAKGEPEERIRGLRAGADDYLAKPFEPEELLLRIKAILRRQNSYVHDGSMLHFGPWRFTPATGELTCSSGRVSLTDGEARLLGALARRPGEAFSREDLCRDTGAIDRSVDVQIARLRRKIETNQRFPQFLQTVRGAGYRLLAQYAAEPSDV